MSEFDREDAELITTLAAILAGGRAVKHDNISAVEVFDAAEALVRERKRRYGYLLNNVQFG